MAMLNNQMVDISIYYYIAMEMYPRVIYYYIAMEYIAIIINITINYIYYISLPRNF